MPESKPSHWKAQILIYKDLAKTVFSKRRILKLFKNALKQKHFQFCWLFLFGNSISAGRHRYTTRTPADIHKLCEQLNFLLTLSNTLKQSTMHHYCKQSQNLHLGKQSAHRIVKQQDVKSPGSLQLQPYWNRHKIMEASQKSTRWTKLDNWVHIWYISFRTVYCWTCCTCFFPHSHDK